MSIYAAAAFYTPSGNRKIVSGTGQLLCLDPKLDVASEQLLCLDMKLDVGSKQLLGADPKLDVASEQLLCLDPKLDVASEQLLCLDPKLNVATKQLICPNPKLDVASEQLLGATDNKGGGAKQPSAQLKPDSCSVAIMELLLPCAVELLYQHVHQFQPKTASIA